MRLLFLSIILIGVCGCAHTAEVTSWEPAEIDSDGIHRVAVINFTGENGTEISSALSSRLWNNDFYTLVDHSDFSSDIRPASYTDHPNFHSLLASANHADVDAVIVGSVIQYRCDDNVLSRTNLDLQTYSDADQRNSQSGNSVLIETQDTLYREATVTIAFRLVDVETGEILASKQISKHYRGEMKQGENHLPEKGRILEKLTNECLDEIVHMLAPHKTTCEMKLATCDFWTKGSGKVKAGLKHASTGDWEQAEQAWQAAIEENPENHAAMYNLSIAAVRKQEFDQAEEHVLDALRYEHDSCYTAGLEKIRERRTALSRANEQREARRPEPSDSLWQ